LDDVDLVAVTTGPGLIGALLVGLAAAKGVALGRRLPLAPVDHLHGHVAALYLDPEPLEPPFLCLLASGGHTLLLDVQERSGFRRLGTTIDDAAGEAFDKGARLLGLGYPGGAALDRIAREGDPEAYDFPVARVPGLDFSFSGLKTSLLYAVRDLTPAQLEERRPDLAASYQRAIVKALVGRLREAGRAGRRRSRAARPHDRQRSDDRLGRAVREARPVPRLSWSRCVRVALSRIMPSCWLWSRPPRRPSCSSPGRRARGSCRRR